MTVVSDDYLRNNVIIGDSDDDADTILIGDNDEDDIWHQEDDDESSTGYPFAGLAAEPVGWRKAIPSGVYLSIDSPVIKNGKSKTTVSSTVRYAIEGYPQCTGESIFVFKLEDIVNLLPVEIRRQNFALINGIHELNNEIYRSNLKIQELVHSKISRCRGENKTSREIVSILLGDLKNEETVFVDGKPKTRRKSIYESPIIWHERKIARNNAYIKLALSPNNAYFF